MTVHDMTHTASIDIAASPDAVYAVISDIDRMSALSPEVNGADWAEGATGRVGDRFVGHNQIGDRTWDVECEVTAADPGRAFGWCSAPDAGPYVHWNYRLAAAGDGTTVTEVWDVVELPPTLVSRTPEELAGRKEMVQAAMAETLAALKATVEG